MSRSASDGDAHAAQTTRSRPPDHTTEVLHRQERQPLAAVPAEPDHRHTVPVLSVRTGLRPPCPHPRCLLPLRLHHQPHPRSGVDGECVRLPLPATKRLDLEAVFGQEPAQLGLAVAAFPAFAAAHARSLTRYRLVYDRSSRSSSVSAAWSRSSLLSSGAAAIRTGSTRRPGRRCRAAAHRSASTPGHGSGRPSRAALPASP